MKELDQMIHQHGRILRNGEILKIDGILTHQLHPGLLQRIGAQLARNFVDNRVDRILTAETAGIAPALATAMEMNVPVVYARKKRPVTMDDSVVIYSASAPSRTKGNVTELLVSSEFLHPTERILIIDDFLATGQTVQALTKIVAQARAIVVGVGVVVEKSFQQGRVRVQQAVGPTVPIVSLAVVTSLQNNTIQLKQDNDDDDEEEEEAEALSK